MSFTSDLQKISELINSKSVLIFDFDGVLADSVEVKTEAFAALYQPYGSEVVDKVIEHHRNNGGMSRFEKFKVYHNKYLGRSITDAEISLLSEKFSSIVVSKVVEAMEIPGASFILEKYCKGSKICVVNSATPTAEIKTIIKKRALAKYFNDIYGSPKSKVDNLLMIKNSVCNDIGKALFIGDSLADYKAANSVGMDFLGIGNIILKYFSEIENKCFAVDDFEGL